MSAERRTDTQIRAEIEAEREGLRVALADLRDGVRRKQGLAKGVGSAIAAGVAALAGLRIVRRLRRD